MHRLALRCQRRILRFACMLVAVTSLNALACAPVVPLRSKRGGAAQWAYRLARLQATLWATDSRAARVKGLGVGNEGWLPDGGGVWTVTFWTPSKDSVLNVTVDTNGDVTQEEVTDASVRGLSLPVSWEDSPRVWAATRASQQGDPLTTLEAEFSAIAEPERYPDQVVWRIRFYLRDSASETHVVSSDARWLARY